MNNILKLLSPFIVKKKIENSNLKLKNVDWKIDQLTNFVFFYSINDSDDKLNQRLNEIDTYSNLIIFDKDFDLDKLKKGNYLFVNNFLKTQKIILEEFYKIDFNKKKLVAITGTNGKTTIAYLSVQISDNLGHKSFSIGTLGIRDKDKILDDNLGMTTPPYIYLYKQLYKYFKNYDVCFMEVSSHALAQERVYELKFDAAVWSSFSQDHLDYHETMESYFLAKTLLIEKHLKDGVDLVVPYAETELTKKLRTKFSNVKNGETLSQKGFNESELPLFFKVQYNKNNLEAALALNEIIWNTKIDKDSFNINLLNLPDGRFVPFQYKDKLVVIDFAHSPEALENICLAIKKAFSDKKLKILFGCGGNRDKSKRPKMGKIAQKFGTKIYITSDNPRFEKPMDIINDILEGIDELSKVEVIEDRKKAVIKAFNELEKNEILLLAGKGHENYIIINDKKIPYSDLGTLHEITS